MLPRSEFSKNVLTVMTGTTFAQVLPIAVSPILTRLYSPEEFGVYYLFSSLAAILAVIASGRFELAILLPKTNKEAIQLLALSIGLPTFLSVILWIIIWLFNAQIAQILGEASIAPWLYLLPLSILAQGFYNTFSLWHNRQKRFKLLTVARFLLGGGNAGFRVILGFLGAGIGGLILGTIGGWLLGIIAFMSLFLKKDKAQVADIQQDKVLDLAKRYEHFPKNMIAGGLFNKAAYELPNILLNTFFAASYAGFFGQMNAVVRRPLQAIGKAFEEVFKQRASEEIQTKGNCKYIFDKTLWRLALIGILPFLLLGFLAPTVFAFVFGENWRIAGVYAQWFAFPFWLHFILSPLASVFYLLEKTKIYTMLEFLQLGLVLLAFFIGKWYFNTAESVFVLLAIVMSIGQFIRLIALRKMVQ